ncbi:MAG: hypothetical protein GY694_15535 [Gammaproteobacteria bacterium]|nr:hypothetical protein [Gammaproteobacteria bacterium]
MREFWNIFLYTLAMLSIVPSCFADESEQFYGLWRSNYELTVANNEIGEQEQKYVRDVSGKMYHFYNKNIFVLIFEPSVHNEALLNLLNNSQHVPLSDSGHVNHFSYNISKEQDYFVFEGKEKKHWMLDWWYSPTKQIIKMAKDPNCYFIEGSIDVYFCRVYMAKP